MYQGHFGLQDPPFSIAPDPRFLFMSGRHREALAHLLFGIRCDGGFVLLTGEVGTGKTTICRCLLEQLPEQTQVACIVNPRLSVPELLATLCDELGITYPEGNASIKVFIDRLNGFLLDAHARGRSTILIIDEAQNLSAEVLEQVRLLTNLETSRRKLLQIILLGQPELRDKLARPDLRQLRQRVTACYHLGSLTQGETAEYIRHRLRIAGGGNLLFSSRALKRVHVFSAGIPRRINILCDRSLLGAYVQGSSQVDARTVVQAARELEMIKARRRAALFWPATAVLLLLLAAGVSRLPRTAATPESLPAPAKIAEHQVPAPVSLAAMTVKTQEAEKVEDMGGREEVREIEEISAIPADSMPPAEAASPPLVWPAELPLEQSRETAYKALFAAWGVAYDTAEHGAACEFAERRGLACLYRRGSLGSLRLLNRPAVLALRTHPGETFFATLLALPAEGPERAIFALNGREISIPLRELENKWLGEFTILWRQPPFRKLLRPGDRGPEVQWLDRRLAEALGEPVLKGTGYALSGRLLERLKAFQLARGLDPDGLVGPNTLIQLDSALGGGSPRLAGSAGGT